jgi:hypothetical protein
MFEGGKKKITGFGIVEDVDFELSVENPRIEHPKRSGVEVQKA